jgi:hypothetical protein
MPSDSPPTRSGPRPESNEPRPFAHGASPFHVKGNVYNGTKTFFTSSVEGGLDTLYGAIDDPSLLEFIQQKFIPVAWYDVLPAVPLIRAEAKAMGLGTKRYLQLRSAFQAKHDLAGVYRVVLKLASIELVALKLPRLFAQVFDFGSSDARAVGEGHVQGFVLDFPPVLFDWFTVSFDEYAKQALALAGARELLVSSRRVKAVAERGEEEMASLQIDLRWKT